jgi:two-component system sensor histidine kinase UhpB
MRPVNWKDWGITPRVILIAVLPVVLMFLSVVLYSYYSRSVEVEEELADRGGLIASLLAESSEYGVISGNLSYLQTTMTWLVKADQSIHSIDILDTDKQPLLHISDNTALDAKSREFQAPIRKALLAINGFNDDKLHVSNPLSAVQTTKSAEIIGHVRVIATSSAMLAKQRQRVLVDCNKHL